MNAKMLIEQFDVIAEAPSGVEKLRELILQLALRGQLVPQDTSTSAEASAGLPAGWTWASLSEVGTISPRNDVADDLIVGFCPMALLPQVHGGRVAFEKRAWRELRKGYTHFADGDVVLAKITPCFQNGKAAVMRGLPNGVGAGTTELHVLRPNVDRVMPEFVLLFVRSPEFVSGGVARMTGTAGQQRVSREYFAQSPFPLPPLVEQHRIVAKVDELMALCDRLETQLTCARDRAARLAASIVHQLTAA